MKFPLGSGCPPTDASFRMYGPKCWGIHRLETVCHKCGAMWMCPGVFSINELLLLENSVRFHYCLQINSFCTFTHTHKHTLHVKHIHLIRNIRKSLIKQDACVHLGKVQAKEDLNE